jgi:hypothetical protein
MTSFSAALLQMRLTASSYTWFNLFDGLLAACRRRFHLAARTWLRSFMTLTRLPTPTSFQITLSLGSPWRHKITSHCIHTSIRPECRRSDLSPLPLSNCAQLFRYRRSSHLHYFLFVLFSIELNVTLSACIWKGDVVKRGLVQNATHCMHLHLVHSLRLLACRLSAS